MSESTAIIYDDNFRLAEQMFGHPLVEGNIESGTPVELDRLRRDTHAAVLAEMTLLASMAEGDPDWHQDDSIVQMVRDDFVRQRQYLRMHEGLQTSRDAMMADKDSDLRDYQQETFGQIVDYLAANDHNASISPGASVVLPTGGGKSRIIVRTVEAMKSCEAHEEPIRILIAAPTNVVVSELLGQPESDIDKADGFKGLAPDLEVGVINEDNKEFDADVVLMTQASLLNMLKNDPAYVQQFTAIILDESHTFLGKKTQQAIRLLNVPIVGFTASDHYSTKKNVTKLLPDKLKHQTALEMIRTGWLSPVQTWIYKTREIVKYDDKRDDFSDAELERIAHLESRQTIAKDIAVSMVASGRRGVITCNTVEEANKVAAELSEMFVASGEGGRAVRAVSIHSKRKNSYEDFKLLEHGELDVVTIVDIDTGWDVPPASFLVNLRPTRSLVKALQRAGRILRPYDEDGYQITAQLFDIVDIFNGGRFESYGAITPTGGAMVMIPQLFNEQEYQAGKVFSVDDGRLRRDVNITMFPRHLRRSLMVGNGVQINKLHHFGMIANLEEATGDRLTAVEAARGLGITVSRLGVLATVTNANLYNGRFYTEAAIGAIEERLLQYNEPIVL